MKSVLLSINPKWCELIASGEKTIEVRKTRPKLETPFKCYIYCTKGDYPIFNLRKITTESNPYHLTFYNQKVIGEFVCAEICPIIERDIFLGMDDTHDSFLEEATCMSCEESVSYLGNSKIMYAWYISELKIYDEPKELKEFKKISRKCWYEHLGLAKRDCLDCQDEGCFVQPPPQSWCYAEALD